MCLTNFRLILYVFWSLVRTETTREAVPVKLGAERVNYDTGAASQYEPAYLKCPRIIAFDHNVVLGRIAGGLLALFRVVLKCSRPPGRLQWYSR